jgi:hypothetical protein
MKFPVRQSLVSVASICLVVGCLTGCTSHSQTTRQGVRHSELFWIRTELYFGMNRRDGASVTDSQWQTFVSQEVTPRFPKGFTVVPADGQYMDQSGNMTIEHSRVLVILHADNADARHKIAEICSLYCKQFDQESVMRVDSEAGVSFETGR